MAAYILRAARAIMHKLAPLTGTVATGNLTVQATGADVVLPRNSYAIPIIESEPGRRALSPHVLLKTTEEATVTAAGASVPVKTILGGSATGPAANLTAGTEVRWSPGIEGIEAVSVVAAPGLTGATKATGYGAVKAIRFYEQIGPAQAAADLFRAKTGVGGFPALVLIWSFTDADDRRGESKRTYGEQWILACVSSRTDSDDERRNEGLFIMEEASELLTNTTTVDEFPLSSPAGLEIRRRDRLVASESSYIYTITFRTEHTLRRRDEREFPFWETFMLDHDTASGVDPEVPIVDQAHYAMPGFSVE